MTDWRWDSEHTQGMTVGAVMWIQTRKSPIQQRLYFQCHADERAAPFVHHPALYARPANQKRLEYIEQPICVPKFEVATTNSKLEPSVKRSYSLLPFRALEEFCLPGAIQQRWEVSVAASKSAEWRLWFQRLDQTQQKAHVQTLSKLTKEAFWAGLWLEYEEWSEPRRTRFVAVAARAVVIFEMENMMRRMEEARRYWQEKIARVGFQPRIQRRQIDLPEEYAEPLSAPLTPHNVISLGLRLAPCYFRVPTGAFRFATQLFSGKSHRQAVAEQKANFASWTRESRVIRIEGQPDHVVWGKIAVHKDAVPKFTPKKRQPQTGKHRYQKKKEHSTGEGLRRESTC